MEDLVELSASQMKLAKLCLARWGGKYLEGMEDPAGAAAEDGKVVHGELENWAEKLIMPKHPKALKGMPHATAPGTASIERPISFRTSRSRMRGFVDVEYVLGLAGDKQPVWKAYSSYHHIVIQDWKTTSKMEYALTEATLLEDIQFNSYAYEAFVGLGATRVTGKWVYLPPSGPAVPVIVEADRYKVVDFVEGPLDAAGHELQVLYKLRPKWTDLPKNTKGCYAFNKQCPYFSKCKPVQPTFNMDDAEDIPTMTDFRTSIANDFPGIPGAPAVPPAPPPPVPPAPSLIASANPGGLSDAEIASLVAGELAKRKATNGPGQVDRSFVNPPEANPTPAANPQQAADQQGIKPPVPVAPIVDAATSWDRDQCNAYLMAIGATQKKSRAGLDTLQVMVRDACRKLGIEVGQLPTASQMAANDDGEQPEVTIAEARAATQTPPSAPTPPPPAPPAPEPLTQLSAPFPTSHAPGPVPSIDDERAAKDAKHGRTPPFNGFILVDGRLVAGKAYRVLELPEIVAAANKKLGVRDFGLIQYEGAARLCGAVEDLFAAGELRADVVVFDSTTREGVILANTLAALAKHRG